MRQFCRAVFLDADHELIGYLEPKVGFMKQAWIGDDFVQGVERLLTVPTRVVWAGPQPHPQGVPTDKSLYDKAVSVAPLVAPRYGFIGRYILNHDKRTYVDKAAVLGGDGERIHPLPMLTAEGAGCDGGRTGGDAALVGAWAGDRISLSATVPAGFEPLNYDLVPN